VVFDGFSPPPGVPSGVAGVATSTLRLKDGVGRPVIAEFASGPIRERIVGTAWPAAQSHVTLLELHD
jgi:hypothetical protein